MIDLLVAADDRTGALETAGVCADVGCGLVPVHVGHVRSDEASVDEHSVVVVDLQTRHVAASRAAELAADAERGSAARSAHKIDSTLRGNWAHELVARQRATHAKVLIVPAFPQLGRTCVDGVVLEHGQPVSAGSAAVDARRLVHSSRPADHLRLAGAGAVVELAGASQVSAWLTDPEAAEFAVCDASTEVQLHDVGRAWAGAPPALLAGTAASIAAGAAALVRSPMRSAAIEIELPALVVCGSLHRIARRQLEALHAVGGVIAFDDGDHVSVVGEALRVRGVVVLASPEPTQLPVTDVDASRAAGRLAQAARSVIAACRPRTVLVIGGDTAAGVLGNQTVLVGGTVAAGMPWIHRITPESPLVLTRAGGFGGDDALVQLFAAGLRP